jgi:cytochrome P450
MATYPNIQAKAQAEIDQAVGPNRLPGYADWDKLPYVKALVSEMFRYGKVAPAGIPHRLRDNDTYAGYFIPKGSIVVTNIQYVRFPFRYINCVLMFF